jgi:hypothetical protein
MGKTVPKSNWTGLVPITVSRRKNKNSTRINAID